MSDELQMTVSRPSRAERTTTSCGECRRRKQRCSQGNPCSNCARRFPQPVCEYKSGSRGHRRPSVSPVSTSPHGPAVPDFPTAFNDFGNAPNLGTRRPQISTRQPQSGITGHSHPLWPELQLHDLDTGEAVAWSGVDITTQYPSPSSPQRTWSGAWPSISASQTPAGLPACDEHCNLHSDAVHDAVRLLQTTQHLPDWAVSHSWQPDGGDGFVPALMPWNTSSYIDASVPAFNPAQDLLQLPVVATQHNGEMLKTFVNLISRFVAAVDGSPDASNPYVKHFVPFCLQSPLLAQVSIYTSACLLQETGHLDKAVTVAHKGLAVRMLNEHLEHKSLTDDEAVVGVIQLILNEWYWGDAGDDIQAHLRGLKEMIRQRGGLDSLGLEGLVSKMVLVSDSAIAVSLEADPFMVDSAELPFHHDARAPFRVAHNTPLTSSHASFATCAEHLRIHPATASILDDMRFLVSAVLALPQRASDKQLQKIRTTSAWIYERISGLPAEAPAAQGRSARPTAERHKSWSAEATAVPASIAEAPGSRTPGARQDAAAPFGSQDDSGYFGFSTGSQEPFASQPQQPRSSPQASQAQFLGASLQQPVTDTSDYLYQAVRLAALQYTRAIMLRQSFGATIAPADFLQLWTTMWRVPLFTWKGLLGVFHWILLAITPPARDTPHDRLLKSLLNNSSLQIGMDNWQLAHEAMVAGLRLQRWLRGQNALGNSPGRTSADAASGPSDIDFYSAGDGMNVI